MILLHDNDRPHAENQVKTYLETKVIAMGNSISLAVFIWHCAFGFSLISFDGSWPNWAALAFLEDTKEWADSWRISKDI